MLASRAVPKLEDRPLLAVSVTYTKALFCHHLFYVFIFNAPYQFAALLNLRPIIFGLASCDWFTYLLTYLLTPWSRVLLEKLTSKLCS